VELSRARARGEIAAVVATGLLFLVFENVLDAKLPFLALCGLGWTIYLVARMRSTSGLSEAWGLGRSNFAEAAKGAGAILAAGLAGLVVYRLLLGWRPLPYGAPLLFLLYPVWAFIQQFVLQALVAGNLSRLGAAKGVVIAVSALLFGLAHLPDWPLVALCAAAGAAWTALYLRAPNLWPLAACHAWLGALAYYWILERDPWREMFG
jgi:membrane protease YdiL (CAAX protease family)